MGFSFQEVAEGRQEGAKNATDREFMTYISSAERAGQAGQGHAGRQEAAGKVPPSLCCGFPGTGKAVKGTA